MKRELRVAVWERDGGCCVICGYGVSLDAAEIHHRRYKSRGGRDELANLISLCLLCHKTQVHEDYTGRAELAGWAVSRYGDGPEAIPVRYFDGRIVLLTNDLGAAA